MIFIQNKKILFLSVAIAFVIWYYIKLGNITRQEIDLPLRITGMPKHMMIVTDVPDHVRVLMESDGRTMMALEHFSEAFYQLDVSEYKDFNRLVIATQVQHIRIPVKFSPKIIGIISPDTVSVVAETKIRKRVPVRPDVDVRPEAGFVLVGGIHLSPDSVMVTCPASLKDSIRYVMTKSQTVSGISRDETLTVGLVPSQNKLISYPDKEITVSLNVQPLGEISINNIPVRVINAPPNHNLIVQPSTFSVRIRGGVQFLASLARDSIFGYVDYQMEQKLGRSDPAVIIQAPKDVTWTQITPNRFKLIELDEN